MGTGKTKKKVPAPMHRVTYPLPKIITITISCQSTTYTLRAPMWKTIDVHHAGQIVLLNGFTVAELEVLNILTQMSCRSKNVKQNLPAVRHVDKHLILHNRPQSL